MSNDLYTVAGYSISVKTNTAKIRFANDIMRTKALEAYGEKEVTLVNLPHAMTKGEIATYFKSINWQADNLGVQDALDELDAKQNKVKVPKAPKAKKEKASKASTAVVATDAITEAEFVEVPVAEVDAITEAEFVEVPVAVYEDDEDDAEFNRLVDKLVDNLSEEDTYNDTSEEALMEDALMLL